MPALISPETFDDTRTGTPDVHTGDHSLERSTINAIITDALAEFAAVTAAAVAEATARAAADALLIPLAQKAAANGVATLGPDLLIPSSQIPAIAITNYLGNAANQAAMLAFVGQRGDWCTRSDTSTTWIVIAEPSSALGNWKQLPTPTDLVLSVNGLAGTVVLGYADVGADAAGAAAAAQAAAIAASQPSNATLTALALLTTTAFGRGFLTLNDIAAAFTKLGLGTAATKDYPASGNAAAGQVVLGNDTRLASSQVVAHSETVATVVGGDPETNLFAYTIPANPTPGDTYAVVLDGSVLNHDGYNYFSRDRVSLGGTVGFDSGPFEKSSNQPSALPIAFRIRLKILTTTTQALFVEHLLYDTANDLLFWAMATSVVLGEDMSTSKTFRASVLWNGGASPTGGVWTLPGYEVRKIA